MAGIGRLDLVVAMARGDAIRSTSERLGISERTIYRRLDDSDFRDRVTAVRDAMISQAVGRLSDAATAAVATLVALLSSDSERLRLQAARAILDCGVRLRDASEVTADIDRIKKQLKELTQS